MLARVLAAFVTVEATVETVETVLRSVSKSASGRYVGHFQNERGVSLCVAVVPVVVPDRGGGSSE